MLWPTKKLGEVAYLQEGPGLRTFQFKAGGIRVINVANVREGFLNLSETKFIDPKEVEQKYKHFLVNDNDILVSTSGTIGRVGWVTKKDLPLMLNTSVVRFHTLNENILLNKFLFYFLCSNIFKNELLKYKTGVAIFNVGPSHIKKIKIPLPPLKIQKQIVERLDKITSAQKLNGELIQKSDELFQSLLHKELNPAGKDWEVKKLGDVCKKITQAHPSKFFKESFHYIDISSINSEGKTVEVFSTCAVKQAPSRARKLVQKNDILFATTRPYLENIAMVPDVFDDFVASTGFCVIRANTEYTTPDFLFFNVISKPFIKKVLPFQRGANYPAVSDKNVYAIKIQFPSLAEQKRIVEKLSAVQDYKKQLLEQKLKLKELFDSVLAKSMVQR